MKKTQYTVMSAVICFAAAVTTGCSTAHIQDSTDITSSTVFDNTTTAVGTDTDGSNTHTVEIIKENDYAPFEAPQPNFELRGVDLSNLPDGSEELFYSAVNVWRLYFINSMLCEASKAETITLPVDNSSYVYYRTGIAYEGFAEYLKGIFTEEWIKAFQKSNVTFINNSGELLCLNVEGVVNTDFSSISFEITEETENSVSFTGTAKYEADDGYTYEQEFSEQMVKTADGSWRLNEFNCWY